MAGQGTGTSRFWLSALHASLLHFLWEGETTHSVWCHFYQAFVKSEIFFFFIRRNNSTSVNSFRNKNEARKREKLNKEQQENKLKLVQHCTTCGCDSLAPSSPQVRRVDEGAASGPRGLRECSTFYSLQIDFGIKLVVLGWDFQSTDKVVSAHFLPHITISIAGTSFLFH